jgi:hypothetical protein
MKTAYSILILSAATATLVMIGVSSDKPKATASPAPIIDHSAELAALQAENADLKESLRVAQSAIHAAPLAVIAPGGGESAPVSAGQRESALTKPTSTAAFVAYPRVPLARSQGCAGGFCQPAAAPKQYQYQSRSSQPRRFVGRLFGRR